MRYWFLSMSLTALFVVGTPLLVEAKAAVGSPTRAIQDLDDMLATFKTGKDLSEADKKYNQELKRKIISGIFDIQELTKKALAHHWETISEKERSHVIDLMVALIEEKALLSKEQSAAKVKGGGKYTVLYRGERFLNDTQTRAFVQTKVLVPSENISLRLNYRLKKQAGVWKVYDIIVDEASLIENYSYQFNSIITKHGFQELVNRIERKLDEVQKVRKEN